jgi:uncharacterized membrane-anchored protein
MEKLNKVAEVSLLFWLMKIVATTLGETFGDYLSMTLDYGYLISLGLTFAAFILLVVLQVSAKKYFPLLFWLVIIATTTLGTEISDFIDRSLHLGYTLGSVLLFSCLLITLYFWFKKFKNLEVYPIIERQKEIFYWTAILFSNSLGTAFGDYLGDALGFTYLQGAMITATVILLVIGLHYATKINHVILFWLAFIFTRPFGATFGDFLTKPIANGGLDLGTLPASMVSMSLMLILIFIASFQLQKKSQ